MNTKELEIIKQTVDALVKSYTTKMTDIDKKTSDFTLYNGTINALIAGYRQLNKEIESLNTKVNDLLTFKEEIIFERLTGNQTNLEPYSNKVHKDKELLEVLGLSEHYEWRDCLDINKKPIAPGVFMVNNIGDVKGASCGPYKLGKYICVEFRGEKYRVHRLVAQTFLTDDPNYGEIVKHINGNRVDNDVNNLSWYCNRKPVYKVAMNGIDILAEYRSIYAAQKDLDGVFEYPEMLSYCCQGWSESFAGFKWRYVSECEVKNNKIISWSRDKGEDGYLKLIDFNKTIKKNYEVLKEHGYPYSQSKMYSDYYSKRDKE